MSGVKLKVNYQGFKEAIHAVESLGDGMNVLLATIGAHMVNVVDERFSAQEGPDPLRGYEIVGWKPLSEEYLRKRPKREGRPILTDTTRLRDSIVYQVQGQRVYVGTNVVYSAVHQFGYKQIEARPYLGVSPEDALEIEGIIGEHLSGQLQK